MARNYKAKAAKPKRKVLGSGRLIKSKQREAEIIRRRKKK